MMPTKFSVLLFIAATTAVVVNGFVPLPTNHQKATITVMTEGSDDEHVTDPTYFEDLELAVHAVTKFGSLDPDMLHKLADKVESGAETCLFETTEDLCEKEVADRKDVAEVLRMQAELQLRMEAIRDSSLFVGDVLEEANIRARDMEMDLLSEDGM